MTHRDNATQGKGVIMMKTIKQLNAIYVALTAIALGGVLFAGTANALTAPEIRKGLDQRSIDAAASGTQLVRGPVGRISTTESAETEAKLARRLVSGSVSHVSNDVTGE